VVAGVAVEVAIEVAVEALRADGPDSGCACTLELASNKNAAAFFLKPIFMLFLDTLPRHDTSRQTRFLFNLFSDMPFHHLRFDDTSVDDTLCHLITSGS
jgi:hypothetical protein